MYKMKRMTTPLKSMLFAQTLALAVIGSGLTVSADYTLESDETWTIADVTARMKDVIDLNGHTLTVPGLKGPATITDTSKTYELLDSITSTGTQYIDTGVTAASPLLAEMEMAWVTVPSDGSFLATRPGNGSNRFYLWKPASGTMLILR